MPLRTSHADRFVIDNLPPAEQWPRFVFDRPELNYPERLNCAVELLDRHALRHPEAIAIRSVQGDWTYAQLLDAASRISHVLVRELELQSGNRVLLRSANSPMLMAAWLAVIRCGGVVVTTMPMLRARELATIIAKGRISHALCDAVVIDELESARSTVQELEHVVAWGNGQLEAMMERHPALAAPCDTARDDPCLLAFTSGTTGQPKATIHFHRDVLAMADTFAAHLLRPRADDIFTGTPPLAFTYGLGAELVFPFRFGASTAILPGSSPDQLLEGMQRFGITRLFTAPTAYRTLLMRGDVGTFPAVRTFISAGEHLPRATSDDWHRATGHRIVDGIGATEMIHIFISASGADIRPGSTGKAVPGYQACILDEEGRPVSPGITGRLAVRGPTGCRYLADERQLKYVVDGWNITGDAYRMDEDGYFWFQARADDMIVSAGYNIAGPEVESALLEHPAVAECAVVAASDAQRGQIVKAFVVLRANQEGSADLTRQLQDFVKNTIAPYKYPRAIDYVSSLPRTATGKLQRYKLRSADVWPPTAESQSARRSPRTPR